MPVNVQFPNHRQFGRGAVGHLCEAIPSLSLRQVQLYEPLPVSSYLNDLVTVQVNCNHSVVLSTGEGKRVYNC